MLIIKIDAVELFDENSNEFIKTGAATLHLEHSLVSLSKWESTWEKPFLGSEEKTNEETIDYIRCMTVSEDTPSDVYHRLSNENIKKISKYIDSKMSATWFNDNHLNSSGRINKEVITAEIIYYWMISLNIPFECQHWHLNKLLTLIKVCNQKNAPEKKIGRQELLSRNKALNEARRQQLNTKG
jgi:hypothetical protein